MLIEPNTLPVSVNHQDKSVNLSFNMLLMHVYISIMTCHKNSFLEQFKNIFDQPENYQDCFLPSMPHDDDYEAFDTFRKLNSGLKFYSCRNDHMYAIGECQRPTMTSKCPTCKEPIGGIGYKLAEGNKQADSLNENRQNGYCISEVDNDLNPPQSIRNMGFLNTYLMRFLLDSTLHLWCAFDNKNHSNKLNKLIANKQHKIADFSDFFYNSALSNVKVLSKHLEQSPDEIMLFVHFVLNQFTVMHDSNKCKTHSLKTKDDRKAYEAEFCAFINHHVIETAKGSNGEQKLIQQLTNMLKSDSQNTDMDQLFRIAYDLVEPPVQQTAADSQTFLNQKQLWLFRKQITIETMISSFQNSIRNSEQEQKKFALTDNFLKNLTQLKLIKGLTNIYKMIELLYRTFYKQIDKQSARRMKVNDFRLEDNQVCMHVDSQFRDVVEQGAKCFVKTFKSARPHMNNLKASKLLSEIEDFKELPLSYLMPSNIIYNDGIHIYSLVIYLTNLQNEFLSFYQRNSQLSGAMIKERVELENLVAGDLISLSVEKDLLQIIYTYSNYSLELRQEMNLEFNFDKIQESIESRFLTNKPIIENNVSFLF